MKIVQEIKKQYIPDPIEEPITRGDWEEKLDVGNTLGHEAWRHEEYLYEVFDIFDEDEDVEDTKHYLYRLSPMNRRGIRIDLDRLPEPLQKFTPDPKNIPKKFGWMKAWWEQVNVPGTHAEPFEFDPELGSLMEDAFGEMRRLADSSFSSFARDECRKEDAYESLLDQADDWMRDRPIFTLMQKHQCSAEAVRELDVLMNRTTEEWEAFYHHIYGDK